MTETRATEPGPAERRSEPEWMRPGRSSSGTSPDLPETVGYRVKRALLGPPLVSDELHGERLGKPVALAVLSSDVMSSSAYASESVLRILIPAAGLGAFGLITPVTALLLVVLGVVCLCYRDVVKTYPVSGGSYVVSRENFGYTAAQIPGAALLCSYTLTVAVSIAAGVDALISAFPVLAPYPVPLAVGFVVLLTYGNLRGIREAGRVFAVPTYWFLLSMGVVIVAALARLVVKGRLAHVAVHAGHVPIAHTGSGLLMGASVFIFLRGFANGGSGLTGMEAISNAVSVFRDPQVRNARRTLMLMASILGTLFLSVSVFAALTHALPYDSGTPTVLSQIGRQVFGGGAWAKIPYYSLQFSTTLILILGANTSFNGFPLLVSFIAQDAYLPRPLTTRGHRLVYSNGVLVLAVLSVAMLLATDAKVADLIPLYACTVFTGFTMAGAGMVKYHLGHPSPQRRRGLVTNTLAFVACVIITAIFVVTEFARGAWLVVVVIPLIVFGLSRTHRRYTEEGAVLAEEGGAGSYDAPTLRHHVVVVLVDRVDLATARALQLARSLALGDELRAVHFVIDEARARQLSEVWSKFGLGDLPLELVECPDRRLVRAATELADDLASNGETEVLMVLPRRAYRGLASRLLHDHTADRIVAAVTQITNVSATIAPFDVTRVLSRRRGAARVDHVSGDGDAGGLGAGGLGAGGLGAGVGVVAGERRAPGGAAEGEAARGEGGRGEGGRGEVSRRGEGSRGEVSRREEVVPGVGARGEGSRRRPSSSDALRRGGGSQRAEGARGDGGRGEDDRRGPSSGDALRRGGASRGDRHHQVPALREGSRAERAAPEGQAGDRETGEPIGEERAAEQSTTEIPAIPGTTPLGQVTHRRRTRIAGRVRTVRVKSWSGVPAFECTVVDSSGALVVVFLGRKSVAGIGPGTRLVAEGAIGTYQGRLAMLNPTYELLSPPSASRTSTST